MSKSAEDQIGKAIVRVLESPNEHDSNLEPANVVDGLYCIARALERIAVAIEATQKKGYGWTPKTS